MKITEKIIKACDSKYHVVFGCMYVEPTSVDYDRSKFVADLSSLFESDHSVKIVRPSIGDTPQTSHIEISKPIGSSPLFSSFISSLLLDIPLLVNIDFPLSYYSRKKGGMYEKATNIHLAYDGFSYIFFLPDNNEDKPSDKNLHEWLFKLLSSRTDWQIKSIEQSPFYLGLDLFETKHPFVTDAEFPIFVTDFDFSRPIFLNVYYLLPSDYEFSKDSEEDLFSLVGGLHERFAQQCLNFYACKYISIKYETIKPKIELMLDTLTNGFVKLSNTQFFNLFTRHTQSIELTKTLSEIYTCIPNLEKIEQDYDRYEQKLIKFESASVWNTKEEDEFEKALSKLLHFRLEDKPVMVFTPGLNEMIKQEISESRTQINFQLLLLAAILTLIGIIVSVIFR